jgi:hypothetical protein
MADANWFCARFDNFLKVIKSESRINHSRIKRKEHQSLRKIDAPNLWANNIYTFKALSGVL